MVMGHARAPGTSFIVLFHMAIFFIASGYLLNLKCADNIHTMLAFIKMKIRSLWFPYFAFNAAYILLNNLFIRINIYTDNPEYLKTTLVEERYLGLAETYSLTRIGKELARAFMFQGNTQMGGALWFFNTLFFLVVGYMTVEFILSHLCKSNEKRIRILQTIVACIGLAAGWCCALHSITFHGLNRVVSYYSLIHIGVLLRKYRERARIRLRSIIWLVLSFAVLLLCLYFPSNNAGINTVSLVNNEWVNPLYLVIVSFAGWEFLLSISKLLIKVLGCKNLINRAIQYISIHSVPIIGMHFLSFKIVNAIEVFLYGLKPYMRVFCTNNG